MKLKFKDAYIQYLDYIEYKQKIQSKETLKERFKNRILPYWENYDIYSITEFDYLKWQNEIEESNYSNNYKNGLHYLMSGFFEYCIKFHSLSLNVAKKVGPFKNINKKVKHDYYTLGEFKKFIKYVDNDIYKQFFNLMFFTGTRPGEAMALRFSDLSFRRLSINKSISEHSFNGKRVIDTPKTLSSCRDIKIDKKLYKSLLKLHDLYVNENDDNGFDYFIFGGIKPLAPTTINRYKKNACIKAHLRKIKLHEFRHSHATLLYDYNVDIQSIKERLGHSDINVTMSTYVHQTNKHEKRVTRTLSLLRLFF